MILQESLNEEEYSVLGVNLGHLLDEIPMTSVQRDRIQNIIDRLEEVFRRANKQ